MPLTLPPAIMRSIRYSLPMTRLNSSADAGGGSTVNGVHLSASPRVMGPAVTRRVAADDVLELEQHRRRPVAVEAVRGSPIEGPCLTVEASPPRIDATACSPGNNSVDSAGDTPISIDASLRLLMAKLESKSASASAAADRGLVHPVGTSRHLPGRQLTRLNWLSDVAMLLCCILSRPCRDLGCCIRGPSCRVGASPPSGRLPPHPSSPGRFRCRRCPERCRYCGQRYGDVATSAAAQPRRVGLQPQTTRVCGSVSTTTIPVATIAKIARAGRPVAAGGRGRVARLP